MGVDSGFEFSGVGFADLAVGKCLYLSELGGGSSFCAVSFNPAVKSSLLSSVTGAWGVFFFIRIVICELTFNSTPADAKYT